MNMAAAIPHNVIIFQIYATIWRCTGCILANLIARQHKPRQFLQHVRIRFRADFIDQFVGVDAREHRVYIRLAAVFVPGPPCQVKTGLRQGEHGVCTFSGYRIGHRRVSGVIVLTSGQYARLYRKAPRGFQIRIGRRRNGPGLPYRLYRACIGLVA